MTKLRLMCAPCLLRRRGHKAYLYDSMSVCVFFLRCMYLLFFVCAPRSLRPCTGRPRSVAFFFCNFFFFLKIVVLFFPVSRCCGRDAPPTKEKKKSARKKRGTARARPAVARRGQRAERKKRPRDGKKRETRPLDSRVSVFVCCAFSFVPRPKEGTTQKENEKIGEIKK